MQSQTIQVAKGVNAGGLKYTCVSASPQEEATVDYAVQAYGHVLLGLPGRTFTYREFADRIAATYDCQDNLRNREVVRVLRALQDRADVLLAAA